MLPYFCSQEGKEYTVPPTLPITGLTGDMAIVPSRHIERELCSHHTHILIPTVLTPPS